MSPEPHTDKISSARDLTGAWSQLVSGLGIFMVLFYLWNTGIAPVSTQWHRGVYALITFVMIFLTYPMRTGCTNKQPTINDILLALVAVGVIGYWILEFTDLNYRVGAETSTDTMVAALEIALSLEAARRVLGFTMALGGVGFLSSLSGGHLPRSILLIGLASLVLGMGVPVTAAYLTAAVLTAGSVSNMIAQHHFGVSLTDLQVSLDLILHVPWVLVASLMIVYWFSCATENVPGPFLAPVRLWNTTKTAPIALIRPSAQTLTASTTITTVNRKKVQTNLGATNALAPTSDRSIPSVSSGLHASIVGAPSAPSPSVLPIGRRCLS